MTTSNKINNSKKTGNLLVEGFEFWFSDNGSIRSPFPKYIRTELKMKTEVAFESWTNQFVEADREEVSSQDIMETFEMILFNEAIKLVKNEEERITICYPIMPRLGDKVMSKVNEPGTIISREIRATDDQKQFLKVLVKSDTGSSTWETEFELPA